MPKGMVISQKAQVHMFERWAIANDELTINVTKASFVSFCEYLKTDRNCRFSTLVDITAID